MKRSFLWLSHLLCLLAGYGSLQAQTNIFVASPPEWVKLANWNDGVSRTPRPQSEGTRFLLDERQENPQTQERFIRIVKLLENDAGVQDSGSLSFYFDGSYQTLTIHTIQIHRNGKILNRLDKSKIKTIQPEPDLDFHMFNGGQSAVIFVEDLRVGDVLEYCYTIRGDNPILAGHYSTRFGVQFGSSIDHQHVRLLWTSDKPLQINTHLTDIAPAKNIGNQTTEYVWDCTNLTAIKYEDYLPASYQPAPYVEVSDFKDWAEVANWALPLYADVDTNLPSDLHQLILQWQANGGSNEEQARLALEFVQDELRYTGIELGPDSYRPAAPAETFQKRFGDCKGKALLLCSILRTMNFSAWPALVNSSLCETVANRLPSPFAFDHVIVKLQLDGKTFWVDPTASHQGGSLPNRFLARFGKALVLNPGATALENIPGPPAHSGSQSVVSTFQLPDYELPTLLTVQTTYRGYAADDMREQIARNDLKDLSKDYLNFYARYYPSIKSTQPISFSDDRENNVLLVIENYQIPTIWKQNATTKKLEAEFLPDGLLNVMTDPHTRLRSMPLRIPFPLRREHEILIYLPDSDWNIPKTHKAIEHDVFTFRCDREFSGKLLRYYYFCETKAPSVSPQKVADYLARLGEMEAELGGTLERPDSSLSKTSENLNWLMIVTAGFGILFTSGAMFWAWRKTNPVEPLAQPLLSSEEILLQGLTGWLMLVGFGLCLGPITRLLTLAKNWRGYFSLHVWQLFAMPQSNQYDPIYAPLLIGEMLGNIGILGLNILVACLFFSKRRAFPKFYVLLLWINFAFLAVDDILCHQAPHLSHSSTADTTQTLSRIGLFAIIWTAYMAKSRRVKATFIH